MLVGGSNEACNKISASYLNFDSDSMSEINFQTTAKWDLPHLYYNVCKLKPLRKEFKTETCYVNVASLLLDIQKGKEVTNNSNHHQDIGGTPARTKTVMEATKGLS